MAHLARMAGLPQEQARLFMYGYEKGKAVLNTTKKEPINGSLNKGMLANFYSMEASNDFMLGLLYSKGQNKNDTIIANRIKRSNENIWVEQQRLAKIKLL